MMLTITSLLVHDGVAHADTINPASATDQFYTGTENDLANYLMAELDADWNTLQEIAVSAVESTYPQPANTTNDITVEISAFYDSNNNGVMDAGEEPFVGLYVLTFVPSTGFVHAVVTGQDGTASAPVESFSFSAYPLKPEGYKFTTPVFSIENPTERSYMMNVGLIEEASIPSTTKIGFLLPLTGSNADLGEENKVATEFGVANFNKRMEQIGNDFSLELVIKDNESNPATALEEIRNLHEEGIDIVIGPLFSSTTSMVREFANQNEMLVLSCCSTAPALALNDNVFRLLPDDTNQGPAITRLAIEEGIDTLVPIHIDDPWGNGLVNAVMESYEGKGKTFATPLSYASPDDTSNYTNIVSQLAESVQTHVDTSDANSVAVLAIGFDEIAKIMEEAKSHDILDDVLWIGADGIANNDVIIGESVLDFARMVNFVAVSPSTPTSPITGEVLNHVTEMVNRSPNPYIYSSYDAAWLIGNSILEAGDDSAQNVKQALPQIADKYIGARGNIKFNSAGDLVPTGYNIFAIRGNSWQNTGLYQTDTDQIFGLLPSTVKIGAMFPHGIRDTANHNLAGARLGLDDFNQYLDEKDAHWELVLVSRDTRPDSSYGTDYSRQLIEEMHTQEGIRAIVGPQFSSNTAAIKEYVDVNNILVVSPSSTATSVSIPNDSIFRVTPDDSNQSIALAQLLSEKNITTIVILHRDNNWGNGLRDGITSEFEALDGNIHTTISYSAGGNDYSDTVEMLNEQVSSALSSTSGYVAVMAIGYDEIVQIMDLASNLPNSQLSNVQWFGTDANHRSEPIIDMTQNPNVAEFADNVEFIAVQATFQPSPLSESVGERILSALDTQTSLGTYAYGSYEAVWLIGLAIENAGTVEGHAIVAGFADAVHVRNAMPNIFSTLSFNENGDLVGADYSISQVQQGAWVRIATYLDNTQSIQYE